ncbi:MAG: Alg9-like mannosyltransferase family-domain-containing protein [Benjaminiella poitrasii]|nr:MAG: Alg9-like mannosyltransferase family-domain-containing protein [Benjaminiella poitrasii]
MGNDIAPYILFTTLCSWFNFLMAARTLSNSIEMVFSVLALNYWPLLPKTSSLRQYRIALVLALLACLMRPTNALLWLFLGIHLLIVSRRRLILALNAAVVVTVVVGLNALLDSYLFKTDEWVFTPWRFFHLNVVQSISLFYGIHSWHWYLSQGLPVILTTFLPFFVSGLVRLLRRPEGQQREGVSVILILLAWIVAVYSLLPHKEFRFLYPIVPLLLIVTAYGLQQTRWRTRWMMMMLVLTQVPMALYVSLWHQRGVMDVMVWLRDSPTVQSVAVLMPCHSTPWYSVVHKDVPMWFLTCEPPLNNTKDELDEADRFYQDPAAFLSDGHRLHKTSHVVLFESLVPRVAAVLQEQQFVPCQRFFNSHFHDDPRRRGDVLIYCRL